MIYDLGDREGEKEMTGRGGRRREGNEKRRKRKPKIGQMIGRNRC